MDWLHHGSGTTGHANGARLGEHVQPRGQFLKHGGSTSSAILTNITQQLGALTASGTGVVVFSTLTYVGNSVCASAGSTYGSLSPLSHTAKCTNYGKFVFTQQYTQGNTNLRTSNFGSAPAADMDTNFNIALTTYVTTAGDVSSFNLLPVPQEDGTDGYQSGQPIYVVEVLFQGSGVAGYKRSYYAYAVF